MLQDYLSKLSLIVELENVTKVDPQLMPSSSLRNTDCLTKAVRITKALILLSSPVQVQATVGTVQDQCSITNATSTRTTKDGRFLVTISSQEPKT